MTTSLDRNAEYSREYDPEYNVVAVRSARPTVDIAAAEAAAAAFMRALGISLQGDNMRETPRRIAKAYHDFFTPTDFRMTDFPNDEGYDELIIARNVPVRSICEHHLLPFVGTAHVGYIPGERIVGLSKLARLVEHFAQRPQVQERLTKQVANTLQERLSPKGVGIVIQAEHSCMSLRGVRAAGTTTVTSALSGLIRDDPRTRQEFFALTEAGR